MKCSKMMGLNAPEFLFVKGEIEMTYYYVAFSTRSQAFLLERRLKAEGVPCELSYMPREIMTDLCNMGVRFDERDFRRAANSITRSGIPGCRLYKEVMEAERNYYVEVEI